MTVIMIVYSEKKNKRFGYVFSTKRKDKLSILKDVERVCEDENLKILVLKVSD